MTRSWLLIATLFTVVAALASFIYLKPKHDESGTFPLSTLKAGDITRLRLERAARPPVVLEKTGEQWLITAPIAARADLLQVQRLLEILDARGAGRLAATDLERFDLDRPVAKLAINAQTFSFGTINSVAREQYVLTGNAVYPVALRYGAALPSDVAPLINKQLFSDGEAPVRFVFSDFTVANANGKWTVTPAPADLSQDEINRWIDDWRLASALRVDSHGKDKAMGEIKVEFKDGSKLTLSILQHEPELVLLRSDQNLQYSFFAQIAKRLLSPPGQKQ